MKTFPFNASRELELEGLSLSPSVIPNQTGILIQRSLCNRVSLWTFCLVDRKGSSAKFDHPFSG